MKNKKELFFETVTARIGPHILASTIRPAEKYDIDLARKLHQQGKCPHNVIFDTESLYYDFRTCATCGKGLGTV